MHHGCFKSTGAPFFSFAYRVAFAVLTLLPFGCAWQSSSKLLDGTKWKVRLNVGLEPGTWMPKRFPGWAESGARLLLDADIEFSGLPLNEYEELVGPKDITGVLKICGGPSMFVSEFGEEKVWFESGGRSIQRPNNSVKNSGGGLVKPEGILRFWLDCPNGTKRRDVTIFPGTRIFFTTGVWDDPKGIQYLEVEYKDVLSEMQSLAEKRRAKKKKDAENSGLFNPVQQVIDYRQLVLDVERYEKLSKRKEELERMSPPKNVQQADNGVQIAPTGSLVIKGNKAMGWLPNSEYLILGTFSTKAVS